MNFFLVGFHFLVNPFDVVGVRLGCLGTRSGNVKVYGVKLTDEKRDVKVIIDRNHKSYMVHFVCTIRCFGQVPSIH